MIRALIFTLGAGWVVLYLGIVWLVIKKYRNTGNVGYLLLGAGVVAWPLLTGLVDNWMMSASRTGVAVGGWMTPGETASIMAIVSQLVRAGLVLAGIALVGRQAGESPAVPGVAG